MYETIKNIFLKNIKSKKKFQFFVLLQPTSPLRNEKNDIDKAILHSHKKKERRWYN